MQNNNFIFILVINDNISLKVSKIVLSLFFQNNKLNKYSYKVHAMNMSTLIKSIRYFFK